jgi:GNAT superfamily N-acetyltransferase
MNKHQLFNAFTRITINEKLRLIRFLQENTENGKFSDTEITEAVECAVKERPSLGGFILTLQDEEELLGALVVNCNGLETMNPRHRLTLMAVSKKHRLNGVPQKMITKAIEYAGGDLALQLEQNPEEVQFFEKLGFQTRYVELRLQSQGKEEKK